MTKSQPQFAFTVRRTTYEFEGRYVSTSTQVVSREYFCSAAGAAFACRRAGDPGDTTDGGVCGAIEKLQPGMVYDFQLNQWVPGMEWKPWYGEAWAAREPVADPFDDMPF